MQELIRATDRYAAAHADADGLATTPIPGLGLMRIAAPGGVQHGIARPILCLVLQGTKRMTDGTAEHEVGAGQTFILTADRPLLGRVTRASAAAPYLALALALDAATVREIAADLAAAALPPPRGHAALFVEDTDAALADCALRLVRLLDRPEATPVLRAPIAKEMHYWLLAGRHGAAIRHLAAPEGPAARVARAVAILRAEYAQPLPVARLAAAAGMSASAFHAHFRAVTSLSPNQFQKRMRLVEARRLMLEGNGAASAAFAVGYESASQFTRDYRRLFGAPPRQDAAAARAA
jgi:AraC-like DNA-binding protein